jgi:hypothetical protein
MSRPYATRSYEGLSGDNENMIIRSQGLGDGYWSHEHSI